MGRLKSRRKNTEQEQQKEAKETRNNRGLEEDKGFKKELGWGQPEEVWEARKDMGREQGSGGATIAAGGPAQKRKGLWPLRNKDEGCTLRHSWKSCEDATLVGLI